MLSDKGCTCYDETTRRCPIPGHPEKRFNNQAAMDMLDELFAELEPGKYQTVRNWSNCERVLILDIVEKYHARLGS